MKLTRLSSVFFSVIATVGIAAGLIIGVNILGSGKDGALAAPRNIFSATAGNPLVSENSFDSTALNAPSSAVIAQPPLELDAEAAAVYDLNGGKLWDWNGGKRWPMASLTKLMTALVAKEFIPDNEKITVTAEAEQPLIDFQTSATFRVGDTLSAKDAIKAMFVVSSNDAAEALATHYGYDKFISAMNAKAAELRMTDTVFVSPSGLSTRNLSTTTDLDKLVTFIWINYPDLISSSRQPKTYVTATNGGVRRRVNLTNINSFAGQDNFIGGKTGELPESGGNLISIFKVNGPKLIIVLGAGDRFKETQKILETL